MAKLMLMVVSIGLLTGCSSVSVKRDYNPGTDFSNLKTFAWQHEKQPETGDPRIDNDLQDERIRRAVNQDLAAKGFRLMEQGSADFLVAYFMDYTRKLDSSSVSLGMGRGSAGRYGSVGYQSSISEYDQSRLTIDFIDPETEKTVWRGVGTRAAYTGSTPAKVTKITNESVSKILKKFPPK